MTIGTAVMLLGLFVVPIVLLRAGHRLRRRPPRHRAAFWGALIGYGVAACASLVASMIPAAMWSDADVLRGLLGFWSLIIGPCAGAIVGVLAASRGAEDTSRVS